MGGSPANVYTEAEQYIDKEGKPVKFNRILNQFLAGVLIMIFHLLVGLFIDRGSMAFMISMYIFVLTMLYIVGMPVDEETGELKDQRFDMGKFSR